MIPPGEFKAQQSALMRAGNPDDPCGRCGCKRKVHFPDAKTAPAAGPGDYMDCLAPTCCVCKYCFCSCVAFVEPFAGQPYLCCIFDPAAEEDLPISAESQVVR